MKLSDIIANSGAIVAFLAIIAEIWENGFNTAPSNYDMMLIGLILLVLALAMKMGDYDSTQVTSEKRSE